MILGATVPGQFPLGGGGYGAAAAISYVNVAASLTITSTIQSVLRVIGRVDCEAQISITSALQAAITIVPAVAGQVNIAASIAIISAITSSLQSAQTFPNPGVSFRLSDKAGGA